MQKKIWNPEMECASREDMRALQSEKLRKIVRYTYDRVKIYRDKMDEAGVKPEDIKTIDDIVKLPFTTREDLKKDYPTGMWAVDKKDIVRIHASSGTTGNPKVLAYTRKDLDNWAESVARGLTMCGQDENSVIQVSYGYGLFTGGLGAHQGAEKIGAMVLPMSSGNTKKQLNMMRNLKSTCLCCTPSYALTITEAAQEAGMTPEEIPLKAGMFGAEPWSKAMKKSIEEGLGIEAHDIYGLTEITGPGVAVSCNEGEGMHVSEDLFFPEIIDPNTLEPLPDGEKGELVFTTLSKEGVPMLRYRTRDICYLIHEPCACGRTNVRMSRIFGRTDDML
ncbi:MAG: phenylacetate--CoA ligase, partial [Eubacteriales bacterium]|nr:phenylacetate--CoA ligase [Eubacteriales bacterium]